MVDGGSRGEKAEELELVRLYDLAKTAEEEAFPLEQAVAEIEAAGARQGEREEIGAARAAGPDEIWP